MTTFFLTILMLAATLLLPLALLFRRQPHGAQRRAALLFGGLLGLFIFIGCNLSGLPAPTPTLPPATPNPLLMPVATSSIFSQQNNSEQQKQAVPDEPTPVPLPPTPIPTPVPTPAPAPPIVVFDEALHPDWTLTESSVEYNMRHSAEAYSGIYSIEMSPKRPRQVLWFTVNDTIPEPILRDDVIGITFRLYSGDGYIRMGDLAATAIGSNQYPHFVPNDSTVIGLDPEWQPDDFSVTALYDYSFSPSRLYFLGISSDIPPNTWVWVTDWFKNRTNDIDYEFVTGFYIRNDDAFRRPVLIDDLQIIRAPKGQ